MKFDLGQLFGSPELPPPSPGFSLDQFLSYTGGSLLGKIPLTKSKIFVSYHHRLDQASYEEFSRVFGDEYEVVQDNSLQRALDSDDIVYIMRSLRENYITGTSCTIVLCGAETRWRKYVDWEIDATLDKEHALIGVQLPTCFPDNRGYVHVPDRLADNISSAYAVWIGWQDLVQGGPNFLHQTIMAAKAKSKGLIQNGRERMSRNGSPPWLKNLFPLSPFGQLGLGSSLFGPQSGPV